MDQQKPYHHGDLRAALIAAAGAELEASGLEKFSLRKVAARAGVSHAAPAHHFQDTSGLLTALAADGFRRFLASMQSRQALADPDPNAQLLAAGLGYIDFAMQETALFRLIHASERPDFDEPDAKAAGEAAYMHLVRLVQRKTGAAEDDPKVRMDVAALWAMAHGLADLLSNDRLSSINEMDDEDRLSFLQGLLSRAIG